MKKRILPCLAALCLIFTVCSAAEAGFSDVASDAWYAEAVRFVCDAGLMSGVTPTAFFPDIPASRSIIAAVLYHRAGDPVSDRNSRFPDVTAEDWYFDAVTWAAENEIVGGFGDGTFRAESPVTREQLAAILWRSAGKPNADEADPFADQDTIGSYAAEAAAWARNTGLMNGKSGNRFDPKGTATRAQLAVILQRWAETETRENRQEVSMLTIQIGERDFTATLADTEAAREFSERLPMTLVMSELNGNEKYNYMDKELSVQPVRPGQIQAGDFMLYGNNCVVLFYRSFSSSYSYTRLGYVDDPTGLMETVSSGTVQITFQSA